MVGIKITPDIKLKLGVEIEKETSHIDKIKGALKGIAHHLKGGAKSETPGGRAQELIKTARYF